MKEISETAILPQKCGTEVILKLTYGISDEWMDGLME